MPIIYNEFYLYFFSTMPIFFRYFQMFYLHNICFSNSSLLSNTLSPMFIPTSKMTGNISSWQIKVQNCFRGIITDYISVLLQQSMSKSSDTLGSLLGFEEISSVSLTKPWNSYKNQKGCRISVIPCIRHLHYCLFHFLQFHTIRISFQQYISVQTILLSKELTHTFEFHDNFQY